MNAILLAGDRHAGRPLHGVNKAFLLLEGTPLLVHVLAALDRARCIESIYVVGPKKPIMDAIEKALPCCFLFPKKIKVLEQKESLIDNICHAYDCSVEQAGQEKGGAASSSLTRPPALFLPADIPLVTAEEIDAFVTDADMNKYDYCLGVTSAAHLKQFYPAPQSPGIRMSYLYLRDQIYRINNLHIARFCSLEAGALIQTIYNHRYQNNVLNRFMMVLALLKAARTTACLSLYMRAQIATLCARFEFHRLATPFRHALILPEIEREFSSLFQMRFKAVEVNIGGAALDIDNEETYKTISLVFSKWRERLAIPLMA